MNYIILYKNMDNKIMNRLILDRTEKELEKNQLLRRGFVTCNNDQVQFESPCLLSGINPSFKKGTEHESVIKTFVFAEAIEDPNNKGNSYWGKKRKQYGRIYKEMAYLDLFPIRESRQPVFEKVFRESIKLRRDLLEISQQAIEELHPRLIIHANRASLYYWGLVPDDPWMGYEFKRVNPDFYLKFPKCMTPERLDLFPFYEITGFNKDSKRINQKSFPHNTALQGCFFMEYVMEYRKKEDRQKMYSAEEWEEIWSWVKSQPSK